MLILAVVVSYGTTKQLPALLNDLALIPDCDVVLVENKTDTEHSLPPGVRLLTGHGNVGYGTAVNLAVADALDRGLHPNWLLVINSDCGIPDTTRLALPELLAGSAAEAVAFPMRAQCGGPGRTVGVLPSVPVTLVTAVLGEPAAVRRWPDRAYPIGAFFAFDFDTFLLLGGFDPTYWLYYEETDLFARLHATGGRIDWVKWPIEHVGAVTTGSNPLLQVELGRSAAVYARAHRLGRRWVTAHAGHLLTVAARKTLMGHPAQAMRAVRILRGFRRSVAEPGWEPASWSTWLAVREKRRQALGALPPYAERHGSRRRARPVHRRGR